MPTPSLVQAMVLHCIADDEVWFDQVSGHWHSMFYEDKVTLQVSCLHRDGYVDIVDYAISLTEKGRRVLERRPLIELINKLNLK